VTKREFLTASIGTGLALANGSAALAQQASLAYRENGLQSGNVQRVASRMARTTQLFKSPPEFPNGIAVSPRRGCGSPSKRSRGCKPPLMHSQVRDQRFAELCPYVVNVVVAVSGKREGSH